MKRAPRVKAARHAVRAILEARAEAVVDAARAAADATVFPTKITVSPRVSRANRAGSFPFPWMGCTAGTRALAALCCEERLMTTTFQKRQKEMKRIEKRKMKEEKAARQRSYLRSGVRSNHRLEPQQRDQFAGIISTAFSRSLARGFSSLP